MLSPVVLSPRVGSARAKAAAAAATAATAAAMAATEAAAAATEAAAAARARAEAAAVEEDVNNLVLAHVPRQDDSWYDTNPEPELIEQCLRPGHCGLPEDEVRDWLHRRLMQLGHAANMRDKVLTAQTYFECAYATKASTLELMSAANMRLKLGQWGVVQDIYRRVVRMDLTNAERQMAERKLQQVAELRTSSPAGRRLGSSAEAELLAILAGPAIASEVLGPSDADRMLPLLRSCGFDANMAGDFEAAYLWFDCTYALSEATSDLLAAANMRVQLDPVGCRRRSHLLPLPWLLPPWARP